MRTAPGGSSGRAGFVAVSLLAAKHWEGMAHGFIALRTLEGAPLADGDLVETTALTSGGNWVTTRLTLHLGAGGGP